MGVFTASCAWFGQKEEVSVRMPEIPRHWQQAFPDLSFLLVFQDAAASWQAVAVKDPGAEAVITCWKAGNSPVLAYPRAERSGGLLRPAGGLYPADCAAAGAHREIALSWRGGCRASVFKLLAETGLDTSLVNAEKLESYLARYPDPWALDLEAIAEKLARGDFTAYDIDLLPASDVAVSPGTGDWFLESPFARVQAAASTETITLPGLSSGIHALFSIQGQVIRIWVGEKETVIGP